MDWRAKTSSKLSSRSVLVRFGGGKQAACAMRNEMDLALRNALGFLRSGSATAMKTMLQSMIATSIFICVACSNGDKAVMSASDAVAPSDYFDNKGRDDVLSGGVKMITIDTPAGPFKVWTKRTGNNPAIKVLFVHGGPGGTHEAFEAADSFFPGAGIEYYYYDALGSYYSDQPDDPSLWTVERFVDEIEQVRIALGLDKSNFFLLGQSGGGLFGMEYALKYQKNLKGLIIANMMSSAPVYGAYARDVLMKEIEPEALAEIMALEEAKDYQNPRYEELLLQHHYVNHVLRMPPEEWPDPVLRTFRHLNFDIYLKMQGPSELGISGDLVDWDVSDRIHEITVPTLVTVAKYDTMDPEHMRWMVTEMPNARALDLPEGSHLAIYDDQQRFFDGVIKFLRDVDADEFNE
jgi:proline iminopeptidase